MKNLKNRSAFTMIELIFVIAILGILAVILIPKLSATRGDARQTTLVANVKICINDLGSNSLSKDLDITDSYIASFSSCAQANKAISSTIEANGTKAILVSNTGTSLDGVHTFGGTCILCNAE